jgi:hypothetical protein
LIRRARELIPHVGFRRREVIEPAHTGLGFSVTHKEFKKVTAEAVSLLAASPLENYSPNTDLTFDWTKTFAANSKISFGRFKQPATVDAASLKRPIQTRPTFMTSVYALLPTGGASRFRVAI